MGILDHLRDREKDIHCPECEKLQKHVHLVENEGREMECPECHYLHLVKR